MRLTPPNINKCCCCLPLRHGIFVFGVINIITSLLAEICLILGIEMAKSISKWLSATIQFSILLFGMTIILNVLLLVASYQKDISMLRLYNYYTLATTLSALVPTLMLLSQMMLLEVCAAFLAIVLQCYVIMLVRSEVVKLENKLLRINATDPEANDEAIDISDDIDLI